MINVIKRMAEALKGSRLSKNRAGKFILEVLIEMVGVTWPSKEEVKSSTVVVVITLVVVATFLYAVNLILSPLLGYVGSGISTIF